MKTIIKKTKILLLSVLLAGLLSGCEQSQSSSFSTANSGIEKSDNSTIFEEQSRPSDSSDISIKLSIDDFNKALKNSKPTKMVSIWSYKDDEVGLELKAKTILTLEYGDDIKASYSITRDKLNAASGEGDFIITEKKQYYARGTSYGELKENNQIKWNDDIETTFSFNTYFLKDSYFANGCSIERRTLSGLLDDSCLSLIFDSNLESHSFRLDISLDSTASKIEMFKSSFKSKKNVNVTMMSSYSYVKETVSIPSDM